MSFLSKNNKIYCDVLAYYIIDGDLYQLSMRRTLPVADSKLPATEIFNKYGCHLSKYNFTYDVFAEWASTYYESFNDLPYDMSKAGEINAKDLAKAVKKVRSAFEKKFNDFPLDGTLYTSTLELADYDDGECFQPIMKPLRKLVNEREDNIARRLILEVEMLDGKSSETKCEFIPFCRFVDYYAPGCAVKVIESIHPNDSYCDYRDVEIENYFNL
jgi:hypothetical protein